MSLHPAILVRPQHTDGDCAIAALAMLLHVPYEDVLTLAAKVIARPHRRGLYMTDVERLARSLGHRLKRTRAYSLDDDTGLLGVGNKSYSHAVVLRDGILIDPVDGEVWFEPAAYIDGMKLRHGPLLKYIGATRAEV